MISMRAARSASIGGRSVLRLPSCCGFMLMTADTASGVPGFQRPPGRRCRASAPLPLYFAPVEHSQLLLQAAVYFAAAVLAVMLSHRLGLGSVAGYLLAGIAIGPWGFKLVGQIEDVRAFAELGVVFLLFVTGRALEPQRLWSMRTRLLGLGASQVLGSIAVIVLVAWVLGVDPRAALVAAMALSLSSTALALQPLTERGALGTQGGQATFAVLLFQDLAVIPMLAVIPLLGGSGESSAFSWKGLGFAVGAIVATLVLGHFLARPGFRHIARTRLREVLPRDERPIFILLLAQGGEFAFVLLGVGAARGAIDPAMAQAITLAVALSMLLTPPMLALHDRFLMPRLTRDDDERPADTPEAARVIVAGLGRVGQVVARLLNAAGIHPTVLDDDPDHVEQSRKFGFRVFYGDATRLDLLHAAGADQADFLIIAIEDAPAITRLARIVKANFPRLRIIAPAHDMRHSFELRDAGVEVIVRETWLSSLKLGETALALIGSDAERARRAAEAFAAHDEEVQAKLYEVHRTSPDAHITVSDELRDQLARTLSEDERSKISKR